MVFLDKTQIHSHKWHYLENPVKVVLRQIWGWFIPSETNHFFRNNSKLAIPFLYLLILLILLTCPFTALLLLGIMIPL